MRRILTKTMVCLTAALAMANPAGADVINLNPTKDNTLYQSATGALSNGLGDYVFAGRVGLLGGGIPHRAVMAFAVGLQIPDGSVINSVVLTLSMSRTAPATGAHTFTLHRLTNDWGEGTSEAGINEGMGAPSTDGDATWIHTFFNATFPLFSSFWTNAGGDFVAAPSASTVVNLVGPYTWGSNVGLVGDVQDWVDGAQPNYGWILIGNELVFPTSKRFDSGDNEQCGVQPVLTIDFTPPPCAADGECSDSDVCTTDMCVNNACVYTPIPNCCETVCDCGDSDVCTTDTCVNNACVFTPIPNCCNTVSDCEDNDVCTTDSCVLNSCTNAPIPTCCNTDGDCDDSNTCTTDTCVDNACTNTPIPICCSTNGDCPAGEICDQVNNVCLPDCNTNGTADNLESCVLQGARSCAQHDCARLCVDLLGGSNVEGRISGSTELEMDLDTGCLASSATVTCDNGATITDETGRVSGVTVNGNTVTVTFSPALPDRNACVVTLNCGASVCIRMLQGDINRNGTVTTGDFSDVRFWFNQTACVAGANVDYNTDDGVTTGDASGVRFWFNNTVPACP